MLSIVLSIVVARPAPQRASPQHSPHTAACALLCRGVAECGARPPPARCRGRYYKGLGTSTSKEAKEYFAALDAHRKEFEYQGGGDDALIDMAFSKKKADMRKEWLNEFEEGTFLDMSQEARDPLVRVLPVSQYSCSGVPPVLSARKTWLANTNPTAKCTRSTF